MDRKEIKGRAKAFAFSNKWNIWKPILVVAAIPFAVGIILGILGFGPEYKEVEDVVFGGTTMQMVSNPVYDTVTSITAIATIPLSFGLIYYIIHLIHGNKLEIKDLFSKYKFFIPLFLLILAIAVFTFLWSLLLIIPGIIYAFKVAMAQYIAAEEVNENTKVMDVINKSKTMMDGHKWEYFVFNLSFIGWYLLCGITFGIAAIWVVPYVTTANVMYYEKLKKLKNA
jgi:uncharacterized membrane protein